jgi:hypothetical protein
LGYKISSFLFPFLFITFQGLLECLLKEFNNWDEQVPKYLNNLLAWGEAGTIKLTARSHAKRDDRRYTCMFVGYSTAHADNTYCMWCPR